MRYFIYCRKSSEAEDRQVASIESQLTTLQRTFGGRSDIEIAGIYEEAFSAAAPGRPQFGEMLGRVEHGDAQGIIAWAPDRLARNSIDGGRLIYMLDCGVVHDLKFATYTFENNSQGKFMLQIMFGQSKYYSDALSENVKRGNRSKIEKGWRPNQAPLGYLNDSATKTIVIDPVHFPLIRKMFDLMLSGACTPKRIALTARDEWGFRTPRKKRIGGTPLAMSTIYKILSNPFYAGLICWNGQTYPGKHEPVVSIDEFQNVRTLLERPGQQRPQRHSFAFTGMIRCGGCGLSVTAEHKRNRYGHRYVYYHCSRPRLGQRCAEPCIELRSLEQQIETFLQSLTIERNLEAWVLEEMALGAERFKREEKARRRSLEISLTDTEMQLSELTGLRLRNLVTDAEFVAQRQGLQQERLRLGRNIAEIDAGADTIAPLGEVISFSNRAAEWFSRGDDQSKRLILETVGSNLSLTTRMLNVEAKKPFASLAKSKTIPHQLGVVGDVRTNNTKHDMLMRIAHEVGQMLNNEDGKQILANIRTLRDRFEPEMLANASKSRRAKAASKGYRA
jgi:DNA invertase Pin-like site-specific DNA recombinase